MPSIAGDRPKLFLQASDPEGSSYPAAVMAELKRLQRAFALAEVQKLCFSLLVEWSEGTSGHIWQIRKGHP